MDILPGQVPADCFRQQDPEFLVNALLGPDPVHVHRNDGAPAPVYFDKAFLLQNRVSFIDCVHIDADIIRQLPDRRKGLALRKLGSRDPEYDLIAELLIDRFFAAEINLDQHIYHLTFHY